jgi:hypothetical protein
MLGMDWGTIVPAAITGAVGLAGIGGTLLATRMTHNAEGKRAKLAEKRRVYAQALAALTAYIAANHLVVTNRDNRASAAIAMYSAVQEVVLTAPTHIADLAGEVERYARGDHVEEFNKSYAELAVAMRKDLDANDASL